MDTIHFIEGILKIANIFLAVVAGIIALTIFKISSKRNILKAWKYLIFVLVLFAVQQVFGALRAFRIYESPYITHIIPTVMLVLLIFALYNQVKKGAK